MGIPEWTRETLTFLFQQPSGPSWCQCVQLKACGNDLVGLHSA